MQSKWGLIIAACFLITVLLPIFETARLRKNQLTGNDELNKKLGRMRKKFSINEIYLEKIDKDAQYLSTLTFTFNCTNRPIGFYADVEHNCVVFHMCNKEQERIPHKCSNGSAFNQVYRVCDWGYNFKCNNSAMWFFRNEKLYLDIDRQKFEDFNKNSPEYDIDIK